MSTVRQLLDITPLSGMDLRGLQKTRGSPFLQNVVLRNGQFTVRQGVGLVREYGSTLNCGRTNLVGLWGYGPCIGATRLRTAWESDQILAVHALTAFTGNFYGDTANPPANLSMNRGAQIGGVAVVVHDLQTGRALEFVLHHQDTDDQDLMHVWPNYATRLTPGDMGRWATWQREPRWAVFAEVSRGSARNVVVAVDGMGLWTYRPVSVPRPADRKNDSLNRLVLPPDMGETCALSPLNLADGPLTAAEGFAYLHTSDLGTVDAICTFNGDRLVYAVGNTVWFSDPNAPHNVLADNSYVLPTSDTVTAVAFVRGLLFVATARQCWAYSPSLGDVSVAAGSLTVVSGSVGCVNNRAYVTTEDGVFFADSAGVWAYTGGISLQWLSEPVDPLWTDPQSLQMVLTDFYVAQGFTDLGADQLPARVDVRQQMRTVRLSYDADRRVLYCVCDDVALVWSQGAGWSVCYFGTHAGSATTVAGRLGVTSPTFVQVDSDTYVVGGPHGTAYTDTVPAPDWTVWDESCYLLKLGRGGALDLSACIDPFTPHVATATLGGLVQPGDTATLTVNGIPYAYDVPTTAEVTLDSIGAALAAMAPADPAYLIRHLGNGVISLVARNPGTANQFPVTATLNVGSQGTFTFSTVRAATNNNLVDADLEDEREPTGGWVRVFSGATTVAFFLGRYVVVPPGFQVPGVATAETEATYWFPLSLAGNGATTTLRLHFGFDEDAWEPITVTAVPADPDYAEMAFVVPSERLASCDGAAGGYRRGVPDVAHQIRVWNITTALPDPAGDEIEVNFDGAGGGWASTPNLNLGVIGPDPLVWLGFRYRRQRTVTAPTGIKTTFWLEPDFTASLAPAVDDATPQVYFWQTGRYPVEQVALANRQQPVDWAVLSPTVQTPNAEQVRLRGLVLTAAHLGDGTEDRTPHWRYGPLNTAVTTDHREWSAQTLDFASTPPGRSEENGIGMFPRMQVTTPTSDPVPKTCGGVARWGDVGNLDAGNLLVDDVAVDELATTDGTQGSRAAVLVHGTMNAPGEGLRLGNVKAVLRVVGRLLRWR